MQMIYKYRAVIALLLCTTFISGCWDRKEINDVAFVIGIAVDKEGDNYRSSLQIALPGQSGSSGSEGGGGGTSGDKSWFMLSNTAKSVHGTSIEGQKELSRTPITRIAVRCLLVRSLPGMAWPPCSICLHGIR